MWKQLKTLPNYVVIEIKDGCYERLLNLCRYNGIFMWDIVKQEEVITAKMRKKDFMQIRQYVRKAKVHVKVIEKKGIGFLAFRYRKHYSFLIGIFLSLVIIKILSLYIWNISFEGNTTYTDQLLLRFLAEYQYGIGMPIQDVDCSEIEKELRNRYEDITWVSAQISGTRLIVHIKENDGYLSAASENEPLPTSIYSHYDGHIVRIITRSGTPLVRVGDAVTAGQELVTGLVSLKNDADEVVLEEQVGADADIVLRTAIAYSDTVPRKQVKKVYTGRTYTEHIIGFPDQYLKLGIQFGKFESYDVVTEFHNISLVEDFYIPLWSGHRTYYEYVMETVELSEEQLELQLKERLIAYFHKLEEKNVQIISNRVNMNLDRNSCVMEGIIEADVTEGSKSRL